MWFKQKNVQKLFENELRRRGLPYSIDPDSGRYAVDIAGAQILVSLDNLERDFAGDRDAGRVVQFVDAIVDSANAFEEEISRQRIYWCLEPSHYEENAEIRVELSDRVNRVLVHLSADGTRMTWMSQEMIDSLGLSRADVEAVAFDNLAMALRESTAECEDIDGVKLGFLNTSLPFKSSLILAPNLRDKVGETLGWPLLAVVPDRDFLYLWAARHSEFAGQVGSVVVNEYSQASYPISTEVYEISDQGIRAIGEFPA